MIYIAVPEGMMLERKEVNTGHGLVLMDVLVDKHGNRPDIMLQTIVKEYLRLHNRHLAFERRGELTIYCKKPPESNKLFLQYQPNNNGSAPSECAMMVTASEIIKYNPAKVTEYGGRWFKQAPLSSERLKEVLEKSDEVKKNRQKIGDTPFSN